MAEHRVFPSRLRDETINLLYQKVDAIRKGKGVTSKKAFVDISKATDMSVNWLYLLANDKIKQPDVGRIETLYCYLTNQPFVISRPANSKFDISR